jgi:hypothetical protein
MTALSCQSAQMFAIVTLIAESHTSKMLSNYAGDRLANQNEMLYVVVCVMMPASVTVTVDGNFKMPQYATFCH